MPLGHPLDPQVTRFHQRRQTGIIDSGIRLGDELHQSRAHLEPDDHAQLRARAEAIERRQLQRAEVLGTVWWGEIRAEQRRKRRGGKG